MNRKLCFVAALQVTTQIQADGKVYQTNSSPHTILTHSVTETCNQSKIISATLVTGPISVVPHARLVFTGRNG